MSYVARRFFKLPMLHLSVTYSYPCRIQSFKPIFHCKLGSHWVPYANEISTNNMKCTWPTRKFCVGDPTQPIFHWLAFGFCVGGNANLIFRNGGNEKFSVLSPYSIEKRDPTQMKSTPKKMKCTWPTRKFCIWDPTQPIFH